MIIRPRGNPDSKIWVILEKGFPQDEDKGYIFSDTFGYVFDKIWSEAGLPEPYVTCINSLGTNLVALSDMRDAYLIPQINQYQPPFIVPLGKKPLYLFHPETKLRGKKNSNEGSLDKWAGSLLQSSYLHYPHYSIASYPPDFVCANWSYRDIQVNIDLGHVKEEYDYWITNKVHNPLKTRHLITEPTFDVLMEFLENCHNYHYVSTDIETIRPRAKSALFKGHCGYPYTNSFAVSDTLGISYSFWDYSSEESVKIWRATDKVLQYVPQIGQNYFTFDAHFLRAMGFTLCLDKCQDTLIRHHILWPELEHKLQFLTRQYTRQPYYKDEGKGWTPKYKKQLMRYNALDTTVTYEVFNAQEEEFRDRPHLR